MRSVTVFLPTYEGLPYVHEAVASLLRQSLADFELVVLDDGSLDGTAEALEAMGDPRVRVLRAPRNVGLAGNWNRALEMVTTPYLALCHQDDVYQPVFLETMRGLLESRPRAFMAHCKAQTIDADGRPFALPADRYKAAFWPPEEPYERGGRAELEMLRRGSYIYTSTAVYRTSAVRRIGLFSTEYKQSIDWNYWMRGVLAGFTIVGTRQALASYRRHPRMTTRQTEADLSRYTDEIRLVTWIAGAAHAAGLADDPRPDYRIVVNTVLSELARRLAIGQRGSARALLGFARDVIPGFAGSPMHRLAQAGCACGRAGGRALGVAEAAWFSLLDVRRWCGRLHLPRRRLAPLPGAEPKPTH
jgi:glycosyltransferase involved in cell wall biosynthesis